MCMHHKMKLTQATAIHLPYLQSYRKEEKCWSSLSKKYLLVFLSVMYEAVKRDKHHSETPLIPVLNNRRIRKETNTVISQISSTDTYLQFYFNILLFGSNITQGQQHLYYHRSIFRK
jgi:hypothetical protein